MNKYKEHPDELLLQFVAHQDAEALSELYDRYAQTIFNLIVRVVRDRSIAEEILQETFWQVWLKANQFSGRGVAAAWLCRIARNKSLDQLRYQKARPQPVMPDAHKDAPVYWDRLATDEMGPEQMVERSWECEYLRQILTEIPIEQRRCLELAYFEGLSQRQIAANTNTPLGTIKTRLRIGLEKLKYMFQIIG